MCGNDGNCGCGEEHDHNQKVMLTDEEGNEKEFSIISVFEVETKQYAVLVETESDEEDGVILRIDVEDDEEYLVDIEDDEEWEKVVSTYESLVDNADSE